MLSTYAAWQKSRGLEAQLHLCCTNNARKPNMPEGLHSPEGPLGGGNEVGEQMCCYAT